jgi:fructose-1-phosphate kinase PfkB-like protein
VDASGPGLKAALAAEGIGIKVNAEEAGEALGRTIGDWREALDAAQALRLAGSLREAVVTVGESGAVRATPEGAWHARPPAVMAVSQVGSGDVLLGALATFDEAGLPPGESLRRAVAAAAANTLQYGGGRFALSDYERLLGETTVRPV